MRQSFGRAGRRCDAEPRAVDSEALRSEEAELGDETAGDPVALMYCNVYLAALTVTEKRFINKNYMKYTRQLLSVFGNEVCRLGKPCR